MIRILCLQLAFLAPTLAATCWRDAVCTGPSAPSFPGPWQANIYAPESRDIHPKSILSLPDGSFVSSYKANSIVSLSSDSIGLVFDFGLEVGGLITLDYKLNGSAAALGLAFTEAKDFIGRKSDNSNGGLLGDDGALAFNISSEGSGSYTMPDPKLRGGFRYLTLFLDSSSTKTIEISNISLEIAFQPTWADLRAYQGYFQSNDRLLDRIWYAGAYTLQTNSVPGNTGRHQTNLTGGWQNDEVIGPGDTVLLDGAKRDRWVWIGDMGIAVPSAFVSTGDIESTKNSLLAIWTNQASNGALPKAGPPYLSKDSDTYHMWALIGTYNYYLYSKDLVWFEDNWPRYLKALDYILSKVIPSGILNATGTGDWGRWKYSTEASSANMLLYRTLRVSAALTSWIPELSTSTNLTADYLERADNLQAAIMTQFWDEDRGAFKDSPTNKTLYPQDANSMAIAYGVVSGDVAKRVSDYLVSNWTPIGPSCPELPNNISPFISSIEIEGHFQVGRPDRALELIRTSWGWYLNNPNGTQSTVAEGYLVNGTWGYRGDRGYRYDPSYVSHAHGWSSGPTSTLTEYLVGLRVTKPLGEEWQLQPASFKLLSEAQAGFTTSLGKFSAKFEVKPSCVTVEWDTPKGTRGLLLLPGQNPRWMEGGKGHITVSLSAPNLG